jgi:uncharacterized protein YjbJ (UPF0337 family)
MMAGTKEKMQGKAMEWEGKATGDPIRQAEGKSLSAYGRLKDGAARIRNRLTDAARKRKS